MKKTVSIDLVTAEIVKLGWPYWVIMEDKEVLCEQQEAMAAKASADYLKQVVSSIEGDAVSIIVSERSDQDKAKGGRIARRMYNVRLSSATPLAGAPVVQRKDDAELKELREENKKLLLQLNDLKWKQEISGLKASIEEAKNSTMLDKYGHLLVPVLQKMVGGEPVTALAGHPDQNDEIEELINRWIKADPQAVDVLRSVVKLAEQKRDTYQSYKPILLSM